MKKRILSFVIVLAAMISVQLFSAEAAGGTTTVSATFYVEKNVDAGLNGNVNVTVLETKDNYWSTTSTYTYTLCLPREADVASLKMSWDVASGVTVKVNNQTVTSGQTAVPSVGKSITYTVTSGKNVSTDYTITTMQSSPSVASLFIDVDEKLENGVTIYEMRHDLYHEKKCFGTLSFNGKATAAGTETYDMSIKGRGNWTWCQPGVEGTYRDKQPYNFTIYKNEDTEAGIARFGKKQNVKFIDGVKAKTWTLIANYADGSLMRNKIGYDLACKLGIGLESRFVDVWMNGTFLGNYMMTAKNDIDCTDNGYALELDNNEDDVQFRLTGLERAGSSDNAITVKDVGDDAVAAGVTTEVIQAWMQTAWDAIRNTKSDEYTKYIDVDSWAKLYLVQELCKNHDIICGSILMHRDGQTENDKLIAGPVWDLDNAWGRIWDNDHNGIDAKIQKSADSWYIDSINDYTSFLQYLGMHEDFMARVYAIFNEYYDAFAGVLTEIDQLKTEIAASAAMNYKAFSPTQSQYNATLISSNTTRGSGTYAYQLVKTSVWDDYVTNLKSYVTARLNYMTDQLKVSAPETPVISGAAVANVNTTMTFSVSGTAGSYRWQSSSDGTTWEDIDGATKKTYSATASSDMNGTQLRCVASNSGSVINTTHVAKTAPVMSVVSEPVTLTVVDVNAIPFYVLKDTAAGLDGNVAISFSGADNSHTGTLYLPGGAQTESLKLCWDAVDDVTVKVGGQVVTSGSASVPSDGESISFTVSSGGQSASYTIRTMQGSSSAGAIFLAIDESYEDEDGSHTIAQMKNDASHETSCFGTLSIDGKTYDMSIKGHGNTTWFSGGQPLDKQPYNITFYKNASDTVARFDDKKNVALIKKVESKKWTLLANYSDGSLMRNKIGFDLACKLGIGQQSRYVDVWMNGEYIGSYLATPKTDSDVSKNGYMLELDNMKETEDPQFALTGLNPAGSLINQITVKALGKNLEEDEAKAVSDIKAWMQDAWAAITDTTTDNYTKYIDVDSWAKLYLLQEYCKNYDIVCGSIFMHRDGTTESDKLIAGPVWDLDNAWGRVSVNSDSGIAEAVQLGADGWYIDSISGCTAFLQCLGKHEDFMARVYEIYNEYYDAFAGVLTEIDQLEDGMEASAAMNYDVWSVVQTQYNTSKFDAEVTRGSGAYAFRQIVTDSWEDYVLNLKAYVAARLKFLSDQLVLSVPSDYEISGDTDPDIGSEFSLTGNFTASSYQWQSSVDGENWTDISGATKKTYTGTASPEMEGLLIRCVATMTRKIETKQVAQVELRKTADSSPVTLTILKMTADCKEENGSLIFSVDCEDVRYMTPDRFSVMVAVYDASGRMAGVKSVEVTTDRNLEEGIRISVPKPASSADYSWTVIAVDPSLVPLFCCHN